jgi:hypothetical protein
MDSISSTYWKNTFQKTLPVAGPTWRGILSRNRFVEDAVSSLFDPPHCLQLCPQVDALPGAQGRVLGEAIRIRSTSISGKCSRPPLTRS